MNYKIECEFNKNPAKQAGFFIYASKHKASIFAK